MQRPQVLLVEQALAYKPIVQEYCQLALLPTLDDQAANRLEAILYQAEAEPLLSLLLDEADYLVAHHQNAIQEQYIQRQQQQLRQAIESLWIELLMQNFAPQLTMPTASR
jgi:hypothetical protein